MAKEMRNPDTSQLLAERAWLERVAYGLVRNESEAKDVTQATLLRALESGPTSGQVGRGWLAKVATNVVRMNYRSGTRRQVRERSIDSSAEVASKSSAPTVVEGIHQEQTTTLLRDAVSRLSEPWRSSVKLRYLDELTIAEVAEMQGVAVGTADSRIREGLRRLRVDLDANSDGDARPWLLALCPAFPVSETQAAQAAASGGKIMTKFTLLLLLGATLGFGFLFATLSKVSANSPTEVVEAKQPVLAQPDPPPSAPPMADDVSALRQERDQLPFGITVTRPDPKSIEAQPSLSFSFSDDDFDRYAGPSPLGKASAVHKILFPMMGCYEAFQQRNPAASPYLDDISIVITVEFTPEEGGIVTGAERSPRGGELEPEFEECLTETSYGLGFHHSPKGLAGGTVRMTLDFPSPPLSEEERSAAIQVCEEELDLRRPGMSLREERFDDLIFADCMKTNAMWKAEQDPQEAAEEDAALDACLREAILRRPSLLGSGAGKDIGAALLDEDEFSLCLRQASNPGLDLLPLD